ncbi:FAD:protein FMN transferase [Fusibacter sp. JL298sf-3]
MKKTNSVILILCALLLAVGCEKAENNVETGDVIRSESTVKKDPESGQVLTTQQSYQIGTQVSIGIYSQEQVPDTVFDELFAAVDGYEQTISKNIEGTEVDLINQQAGIEPVKVSEGLFELVTQSLAYAKASDGLLDVSIGPVVNLWDIGTDDAKVPTTEALEEAVSHVGYENIELDAEAQTVFLKEKGMVLDLGGIAKGYIADEVAALIRAKGYERAILNFGGNVLALSDKRPGTPWVIGVRNPLGEGLVGTVKMVNQAAISSGVYERFFIEDGVRYHHILNPETGFPEQNGLVSVTIVTPMAIDGDALSTTLFLMGLDDALAFAEEDARFEVILITDDYKLYTTKGVEEAFELENDAYEWIKSSR